MLMNYFENTSLGEYSFSYFIPKELKQKYNLDFQVKFLEDENGFYVLEFFNLEGINLDYIPEITENELIQYLKFFGGDE